MGSLRGSLYYASRYGSTEEVCRWVREGISHFPVALHRIRVRPRAEGDFFILGTPIFIGKPLPEMVAFIEENKALLRRRPVFLFITSWAQSTPYRAACNGFLELICRYLKPCEPAMTASLPGKMNWDTLTVRDRQAMTRLLRRIDARSAEFDSEGIRWSDQRDRTVCRRFGESLDGWLLNEKGERAWTER